MKELLKPEQNQNILIGEESARGLRERNKYEETELKMQLEGFTAALNTETPPVAINLKKWQEDAVMVEKIQKEFEGKPLRVAVFGIATANGIGSILDFAEKVVHANQTELFAIDINPDILKEVDALRLPNVITLHEDARNTSLTAGSIDLVVRDHIGNCCPPEVDRAIDKEAVRILRKNGLSMTNITTSELLTQSVDRISLPFEVISKKLDENIIRKLQTELFDLNDIAKTTTSNPESIRGLLLEIEPNGSFVIFGSGKIDLTENVDLIGHGEWFRSLNDHIKTWASDGFTIEDIRSRSGTDSHAPKLTCWRHIVLLKKI
jgi:antitoxin component of RelBE/YafQ-DinJ toxin-antitoxin module